MSQTRNTPVTAGIVGGRYQPIKAEDLPRMDQAVRHVLQHIGLSHGPDIVIERVTAAGGQMGSDGRLTFSAQLIDDALKGIEKNFTLHGQLPGHELDLTGSRVYMGSGGAAPRVLDLDGNYRDSTLRDLYDAARLVDRLENIHFFSRSVVARDMPDDYSLDINTAYACLAGTSKHVMTSASVADHVDEIADMCFTIAGSRQAFLDKPFLSMNINHVVSPLRLHSESCEVMMRSAELGLPVHANVFGQMGASSPVTLAGCVAQTVAESLAGMIFTWLVNPQSKIILGTRPMITDLRTGAVSGGSGEQAKLMAATSQMAQYYGLANSTIAGATDSKLADAQSGYEKNLTVSLAAQAGCNLITQAAGMQAMLMVCALESYIIDNDMLGGIARSLSPLEVDETTLALTDIDEVVHGDGHFLGQADTLARMQSDFLYPGIADRLSVDEWMENGSRDINQVANEKTREILASYFPQHLPVDADKAIRGKLDIRLSEGEIGRG